MKAGAVVEALFGQRLEILDCLGRDVRPEFDDHFTFGRFDHGYFVYVHRAFLLLGFSFVWFGFWFFLRLIGTAHS